MHNAFMHCDKSLIQQLLDDLTKERTQTWVAEKTGIDQSIISRIITGAIVDPGSSKLAAIQALHAEMLAEKAAA